MCDCLKTVLEKITPMMQPKKEVKDFRIDWADRVWRLDGGVGVGLYIEATYYGIKKNGDTFANKTTKRNFVAMTFCPFCGQKFKKGEPLLEEDTDEQ